MLTDTSKYTGNTTNLQRLIWLRFIVIAGESSAIAYAVTGQNMMLPLRPLSFVLITLFVINILTLIRVRLSLPVSNIELFSQFTVDVIALTILLFMTGGSTNPFAPLYLLPLTLTAATLPGRYAWAMVLLTVTSYYMLLHYYIPLPDMQGSHEHSFRLHVIGMWLGFLLSSLLIASFVVNMARTVRRQDQKISNLREQQLRQERLLALGTLATGAAHELGTPLSTMAILLKDVDTDVPLPVSTANTLQQQVDRCKTILGTISAAAGEVRAESGTESQLDIHLQTLIEQWQSLRPEANTHVKMNGFQPAPYIVADQTLDQAILNILNNAADASPHDVSIDAEWSEDVLRLEVSDRGSGLSPDIASTVGDNIKSTKQDGLGLGLFLTYATLERLGGKVQLYNREGGGVICLLTLPLSTIQVSEHNA